MWGLNLAICDHNCTASAGIAENASDDGGGNGGCGGDDGDVDGCTAGDNAGGGGGTHNVAEGYVMRTIAKHWYDMSQYGLLD